MSIVEDFMSRYRKEYDFYDQASRFAAQQLEARLQAAGIRAITTSRAKTANSLEPKVRERAARKRYTSVEDVYDDIVDLAGVRVALYFPAHRAQVDQVIGEVFTVSAKKSFPDGSPPKYEKRFSGYFAVHYRVHLKEAPLPEAHRRYAEARIEIQVASVLMHAWSEVEHDLVYKPFQGPLSVEEYLVLDELNGLVLAGEIALERLQGAGATRVAAKDRAFTNHYELAAHLLATLKDLADPAALASGLGRVDLLFSLLAQLNLATPEALSVYVKALHGDLELRPISEQIVDQILQEDASRYKLYEAPRAERLATDVISVADSTNAETMSHATMGEFIAAWAHFEDRVKQAVAFKLGKSDFMPLVSVLRLPGVDSGLRSKIEKLRRMRNQVVHGVDTVDPATLKEGAQELKILETLVEKAILEPPA